MPQIKRILFPVDFSESCRSATRYMEAFAGKFEAEVLLVHAVAMGEHNLAEELLPVREAQLDTFMADELKYFSTRRMCVAGDASTVLMETAESWKPDLVMMPTHGLGYFRRHLLGSVTAKALHDLRCPVWTSVHSDVAPALEDIHCRKILCAVDLTEPSRGILEWAAWLAGEYQASLGIVNATMVVPAPIVGWQPGEEMAQYIAEEAQKRIGALQAEAHTVATAFINPGDPASVVASAATEFGADLLVIGRHGSTDLTGKLLQHAYSILRESPCPVISI